MKVFGDALDPALGFLPRPGIRLYRAASTFAPRPQGAFWQDKVRQFFFGAIGTFVTDRSGEAESWEPLTFPRARRLRPPGAERPLEAEQLDSEAVVKRRWTFRM